MSTIDQLTKRYRNTTAVDGLSFEVGPGRVTGFLGPNGAGKTTSSRMLPGLAARRRDRHHKRGPHPGPPWPPPSPPTRLRC